VSLSKALWLRFFDLGVFTLGWRAQKFDFSEKSNFFNFVKIRSVQSVQSVSSSQVRSASIRGSLFDLADARR
jgi:hypothetical protein